MLLDHDGYLPSFACISDGKKSDIPVARSVCFAKGSIVVVDRGYTDFGLFGRWTEDGVFFVTRQKTNADYIVVERREASAAHIVADEIIELTGLKSHAQCPHPLRRVVMREPDSGEVLVFLTNHLRLAASTICAIYKDRWQIETFFKALKQNLKVKTFVGTSENALRIQIWTALIAMLLIKYLQFKARFRWSLSNLVAFLRWNLFTYRNLWDWIHSPFDTVALQPGPVQKPLPFSGLGQQALKTTT
jgi:IS4 transposase